MLVQPQIFSQRKKLHKSSCNNENDKRYNLKLYSTIRENGGWDNWTMVQIEEYSCNNKREAVCREEYWRVKLHAQLNMRKAFGAETIVEYQKQYREENKEEIKDQRKHYYETNKDEINKRNKQYRNENKEEVNKRKREQYQLKKQLLQENKSNV